MPKLKYIKQNVFLILSILTIGFPFVGYKILGGIVISRLYEGSWLAKAAALLFIVWGLIDLLLNAVSLHAVSCRGNLHYPVCLLSIVSKNTRSCQNGVIPAKRWILCCHLRLLPLLSGRIYLF